ncbi:hypothetical protein EFQ99_20520 [Rhizobium vallis]|uniref:Uncharacterized protein n=1 Tax=Rhizobium vallis TaxID=634290 RepID=A0A432PHD4_9HYPH|nr:hypothetical protein [Rhizobium vallis]RUM23664.1 hypothetical protein EFQ99_20520 [Rhizobium vallis]
MGETVERKGQANSEAEIKPKLHRIKAVFRDASQKLNYAINKQNDIIKRNFISSSGLIWQSSVAK